MATVTKKNAHNLPDPGFGGVAYGNMFSLNFKFEVNASGIMADSDKAAAIAATDKVILGKLPAGMRLIDCKCIVSDTFTDTATFDLGFEYCDGVDVTGAAEDADYFMDAGDYHDAAAILTRNEPVATITLPKDAYLILTNNTAALDAAGIMDIEIIGVMGGPA